VASGRTQAIVASKRLNPCAGSAFSAGAALINRHVYVLVFQWVVMLAVGLSPVVMMQTLADDASASVLLNGDRTQVRWIDAIAASAQMVYLVSFWNRTDQQQVGCAVCGDFSLSIPAEHPVSGFGFGALPMPARTLGALSTEALPAKKFGLHNLAFKHGVHSWTT